MILMAEVGQEEAGFGKWCVPEPRAVFLLVHGLGAHGGRWEAMAAFLLKKGFSSYAIELRGPNPVGGTDEKTNRLGDYRGKILRLHSIAAKNNPAKKVFLIGESMGAVISFLVSAGSPGLFSGLICISPAFSPRRKTTFMDYVRTLAPLVYNPDKQFELPFDSSMCTRDADYRNRLDRDPREYRTVSSRFILEILMMQARARSAVKKMLTPVLFLVAEADMIVDPQVSRAVFSGLAVKDKTLVGFPGMYHSLSIELGKETVFEEILKWTEQRL